MAKKAPTVIGNPPDTGARPTVIGGAALASSGPTIIGAQPMTRPTAMVATPTAITVPSNPPPQPTPAAPTAIGGSGVATSPTKLKGPSVLSLGAIAESVQRTVGTDVMSVVATVLPGSVRRYLEVSADELKAKFPNASSTELEAVRVLLSDEPYAAWESSDWLAFGRQTQEKVNICIKDRLKYMENNDLRATSRHLLRMNAIFSEVLSAFNDKGFFAKSPLKVWEQSRKEVKQLEQLLGSCYKSVEAVLRGLNSLRRPEEIVDAELNVHLLTLEVLAEKMDPVHGNLILGRRDALTTTKAMLLEHTASRQLDEQTVSTLMERVNDGVLVYLPTLYTTLARISDKSNTTDKFMFVESITTLQEKLKV